MKYELHELTNVFFSFFLLLFCFWADGKPFSMPFF